MSTTRVLRAAAAITPFERIEHAAVAVRGGSIAWVGPLVRLPEEFAGAETVDLSGCTLAPGFVDIHIHGGGGRSAGDSPEALESVAAGLAKQGTTAFLPTLGGVSNFERLLEEVRMVEANMEAVRSGARIVGIHLEGPFLNPDPRARGSQNVDAMRRPDVGEFDRLYEASKGTLRYMTIAPELPGAIAVIERMRERGVVPSAGHTVASYEEVDRAIAAGLISVTHTYNGMPPMHHRDPGMVGAALTRSELNAELIGDGQHVGAVAMRVLYNAKGADRITLVTDNTRWAGMPNGRYPGRSGRAVIKEEFRCYVEGGSLAGSVMPMNYMVKTVMESTGSGLAAAVRMASYNPARLIGLGDRKGSLEPGKDADLTAFDEGLNVRFTMVEGSVVHQS